MGIPKIIFSPESHHPPHPCISGEIRHHPSAQLVVLFVVVSSFPRIVAISPSTLCLLLDKFTAPEFREVARELSDPFFASLLLSSVRASSPEPCAAARRRETCSGHRSSARTPSSSSPCRVLAPRPKDEPNRAPERRIGYSGDSPPRAADRRHPAPLASPRAAPSHALSH